MQARAAEPFGPSRPRRFSPDVRDILVVTGLLIATVFAHPVHQILTRPYWYDEAWVAALTRVPVAQLRKFGSSTPIGWLVLLRLVPGSGLQRGRILALLFAVGAVGMAYGFVRALPWGTRGIARFGGTAAAIVVMLAPVSMVRNDLKQYTADGFCALAMLALAAWTERRGDRRTLVCLGVVALAIIPFSTTSAFVTVAAFGGLFVAAVVAGERRRIIEVVVVGATVAVGLAVFFAVFVLPTDTRTFRDYWKPYYLDGSPWAMLTATWTRLRGLGPRLAIPALLVVALFFVGVVVFARLGQIAVAAAVVLLWIEAFVLGAANRYPFLDQRTSHYLLVASLAVVATGAVGVVVAIANRHAMLGAFLALSALGLFAYAAQPYVRSLDIPPEDLRTSVDYLAAHRSADDVILVSSSSACGFAYYWRQGPVQLSSDPTRPFRCEAPAARALYATDRTYSAVLAALSAALVQQRRSPAGSRLFIVRTHVVPAERDAWNRAFVTLHVTPGTVVRTGPEPVLVVDRRDPAVRSRVGGSRP